MDKETLEKELKLDRQLCFALYGAAHAFTRAYKPLLSPLGLTYPQYVVMMALWEEDDISVKALGEKVGLDSGTLSPLLKRLEQINYVARRRDAADERVVFITLTNAIAIVLTLGGLYVLSMIIGPLGPVLTRLRPRWHFER